MKAGTTKKLRNKKQWEVLVIGAGPAGVLAALRAADLGAQTALVTSGAFGGMAAEGGSYRVVVSLTRTVLWLLSGIFDKAYAKATAGSTDEHTYIAPDLFTAETPLGSYQGMTDQIVMSRTPGSFRTVFVPRGSSKPEWLVR
jgi:phytoene dehydrogenase-like protein